MRRFREYLAFKKLIMPRALQFLFWAGIGGVLYGTWWLFTHDNWAWVMSLVFGTLLTRLVFEALIVRYKTYICLTEIRDKLHDAD